MDVDAVCPRRRRSDELLQVAVLARFSPVFLVTRREWDCVLVKTEDSYRVMESKLKTGKQRTCWDRASLTSTDVENTTQLTRLRQAEITLQVG